MPALNSNDTEYVLVEWYAGDGTRVEPGEPVALVETSKAAADLCADAAGVLHHVVAAGTTCKPGSVVAMLTADAGRPTDLAAPAATDTATVRPGGAVLTERATELARRHGIPAERIASLGQAVVRAVDVQRLVDADDTEEVVFRSRAQLAVAATVTEAQAVPAAFTVVKVELGRSAPADVAERVIAATAAQREKFPAFFARLIDDGTVRAAAGAQIGVTVDVGQGLFVPVLPNAHEMSIGDISAALMAARVKARRSRFKAADLVGANITVTLHTDPHVVLARPIIRPGTTCALSVCAVLTELRLGQGGGADSHAYFHLGAAYDHRVVNGRDAVLFLQAIKSAVERAG